MSSLLVLRSSENLGVRYPEIDATKKKELGKALARES
jgi:hypothetical protein